MDPQIISKCTKCELHATRRASIFGKDDAPCDVLIVGECPNATEEQSGIPFMSQRGKLFKHVLDKTGVSKYITQYDYLVKCRPPIKLSGEDRAPKMVEIKECAGYLIERIAELSPKVIIVFGSPTLKFLFKDRSITLTEAHGLFLYHDEFKCYVVPMFDPSSVITEFSYYKYLVEDLTKVCKYLDTGTIDQANGTYTVATTWDAVESGLSELSRQLVFSVDVETTGLSFYNDQLLGIGFSWKEGTGWYLPLRDEKAELLWTDEQRSSIQRTLDTIFRNEALKIGFNFMFDIPFLMQNGFTLNNANFDCLLAYHLISEHDQGMQDLKELSKRFTDLGGYANELRNYQKDNDLGNSMVGIPLAILGKYCSSDCDATLRLYTIFKQKLIDEKVAGLFKRITMPLCGVLTAAKYRGVQIDPQHRDFLEDKYSAKIAQLTDDIITAVGFEFNINSNKQLQDVLFNKLGLTPINKTATGYSVNAEVLQQLAKRHPVAALLVEHRESVKIHSTYVSEIPIDKNFRIHTNYNIAGTTSGRLTSSGPNLQQIPRDPEIRKLFCAKEGHVLVQVDFSAAEFRAWCHYAADPKMRQDIIDGFDPHKYTAAKVFGVLEDQVTKEQRTIAKSAVFGVMYGQSVKGLANMHNIAVKQAQKILDTFFARYPKGKLWLDLMVLQAKRDRVLVNFFGRKRRFVGFDSPSEEIRSLCERQAKNYMPQSTVADITNWTSVRLAPLLKPYDAYLVLNVHDSLMYETPEQHATIVAEIVEREATRPIKGFTVPLAVEMKVHKSWI